MTQQPGSLEELARLFADGKIDRATFLANATVFHAELSGSGALAQGPGAMATGSGGVGIQGDNNAPININNIIQQAARPGASPADLRRAYLARILIQANQLPLFAGDGANAQVRLASVYTALLTQRSEADTNEGGAQRSMATPERDARRLSALEVLNVERRLVLLGGPGSGKTTFVNFVALAMAGELLGIDRPNLATLTAPLPAQEAAREKDEPKPQRWEHGALLPVQVVLRDLASQLPAPGAPVKAEAVWSYIQDRLSQAALEDFAPVLREAMLQPHGALIMLDGLDEVPDALDRRKQIKQAVQDFAATFSRCRFLVTSRTYAYQRQDWKLDGFAEVQLQPFSQAQIHGFVNAWYTHMVELFRLSEHDARNRAEVLIREVDRNERLRELAERPLLLTLIAQLQTEGGGTLPEKREELYDRAVEMLLNQWENMKPRVLADGSQEIEPSLAEWLNASRDGIRQQLNRLAFEAHRDQTQLTGTADIRQERLIEALLNASANRADVKVRRLEEYLRDRAGILAAHGVGMVQFPHRSFQEYLAACHLTDDDFPDKLADLARADPNRWREVALLAGAKAARGSALSAWALSEALCLAPPPAGPAPAAEHWGALLAGRVLAECANLTQVAPRNVAKLQRVRDWQLAIMRGNTLPAGERALAGRTLAALGDPRTEVMTLDGMQFCLMPAGRFVMGSDGFSGDEKPQHTVDLNYPCFIGRFPVSVAQWREYVQRSGHIPDDDDSLRGDGNQPVAHVTWNEALAFCATLTRQWQALLPKGFAVVLPSEAEWEKAARGGERVPRESHAVGLHRLDQALEGAAGGGWVPNPVPARDYPWGETFDHDNANVNSKIGQVSALGCYDKGRGPYGCEDLSGNVLEWTRSLWGKDFREPEFRYPYRIDEPEREDLHKGNEVMRVVRGGSWIVSRDDARCAVRSWFHPGNRNYYLGFRVVLRSSPVL